MPIKILPTNFFDEATISVTPAAVSTLPVTNLQSNTRDRVWRSTSLAPQVVSGTWSSNARPVNCWGLWPGLGEASLIGSQVRVQLYSDSAYTTQVYDSGTIDFFPFTGAGWGDFDWGSTPWGVEEGDRTARLAPLVKFFTQVTASSFKVTITNGGAVDTSYFEARRFWLAQAISAPYSARPGAAPAWQSSSKHDRTPGAVLKRRTGARWRELRFESVLLTESDRAKWSDLLYACDPAREIVLSIFPSEGTRRERDFTVMGSLEVLNPMSFNIGNEHAISISIVES